VDELKIKVVQVREAIIELDPENYPENFRNVNDIIEIEKHNAGEDPDYMDFFKASELITVTVVDENDPIQPSEDPFSKEEEIIMNEIVHKVLNDDDILNRFADDMDLSDKVLAKLESKINKLSKKK
jgi:hypothetical protein